MELYLKKCIGGFTLFLRCHCFIPVHHQTLTILRLSDSGYVILFLLSSLIFKGFAPKSTYFLILVKVCSPARYQALKSTPDIAYEDVLNLIKKEGMSGMLPVYRLYRDQYLSFASKYSTDRDVRIQSYHDAIVQTYQMIVRNKFDPKQSALKTFIFHVGKNKLINKLDKEHNRQKRMVSNDEQRSEPKHIASIQHDQTSSAKWKDELDAVFDSLGEKCQNLIVYFYYDALDSEEIMKLMGYDSVNVVYSAKSRCLKKLRELIHKNRQSHE